MENIARGTGRYWIVMIHTEHRGLVLFFLLIAVSIMLIYPAHRVHAEQFYAVETSGGIRAVDEKGAVFRFVSGEALPRESVIRTYKESECVISNGDLFYKIYPFSKVKLGSSPELVYGKLSQSKSTRFVDLHFYLSGRPIQGHTLRIIVRTTERDPAITALIQQGHSKHLSLFPLGRETYRAFAGFDVEAAAHRYDLVIRAENDSGSSTQIVYPFYLRKSEFERGTVKLPTGKGALFEPSEKKEIEREQLSGVLAHISQSALWEGKFSSPVHNPVVISSFGKKRAYYLSSRFIGFRYHRGIDFRADRDQNVYAPNSGFIVFARRRVTTGNTVVVDHGQGVFSLIFHLDSISVSEGRPVKKGEKIGGAGATGLAAGVHVHWSVIVDGTYVDPEDWVKSEF